MKLTAGLINNLFSQEPAVPTVLSDPNSETGPFGVSWDLINAVTGQESGGDPMALSSQGARGKMQVMPATGKDIAEKLGEEFDEDMLFDPETNTRYGAYYLKEGLDKYGGDVRFALARYHGGDLGLDDIYDEYQRTGVFNIPRTARWRDKQGNYTADYVQAIVGKMQNPQSGGDPTPLPIPGITPTQGPRPEQGIPDIAAAIGLRLKGTAAAQPAPAAGTSQEIDAVTGAAPIAPKTAPQEPKEQAGNFVEQTRQELMAKGGKWQRRYDALVKTGAVSEDTFSGAMTEDDKIAFNLFRQQQKFGKAQAFLGGVTGGLLPGGNALKSEAQKEVEQENPITAGAGQVAGTTAQAIIGAGAIKTALSKIPFLAKAPSLVQNALTRVLAAGGVAAGQSVGRDTLRTALENTAQSAGGGLVSIVPEIVAPAGIAQLVAQPLTDIVYDAVTDAAMGREGVFTSKEWWKKEALQIGLSLGFAIRDVKSGKVFKAEQGAQREELKQLARWMKPRGSAGFELVEPGSLANKLMEPTEPGPATVFETKPGEEAEFTPVQKGGIQVFQKKAGETPATEIDLGKTQPEPVEVKNEQPETADVGETGGDVGAQDVDKATAAELADFFGNKTADGTPDEQSNPLAQFDPVLEAERNYAVADFQHNIFQGIRTQIENHFKNADPDLKSPGQKTALNNLVNEQISIAKGTAKKIADGNYPKLDPAVERIFSESAEYYNSTEGVADLEPFRQQLGVRSDIVSPDDVKNWFGGAPTTKAEMTTLKNQIEASKKERLEYEEELSRKWLEEGEEKAGDELPEPIEEPARIASSTTAKTEAYPKTEPPTGAPPSKKGYMQDPVERTPLIRAMELPEVTEFSEATGPTPRVVRKIARVAKGNALGVFRQKTGDIELRSDIFIGPKKAEARFSPAKAEERAKWIEEQKQELIDSGVAEEDIVVKESKRRVEIYQRDHDLAQKVLAHETWHRLDTLPAKEMPKGNILAHLASLKEYYKNAIDALPVSRTKILTTKERRKYRKQAIDKVNKYFPMPPDTKPDALKSWKEEVGKKYQEILGSENRVRDLITKEDVMAELKANTKELMPFTPGNDKYTKYRHRPEELYAEAGAMIMYNPKRFRELAPKTYRALFGEMDPSKPGYLEKGKTEFYKKYMEIQDRIEAGQQAVYQQREQRAFESYDRGSEAIRKEFSDRAEQKGGFREDLMTKLWKKQTPVLDAYKEATVLGYKPKENEDPARTLEEDNYVTGLMFRYANAVENDVRQKFSEAGIDEKYVGVFMQWRRAAGETKDKAASQGVRGKQAEDSLAYLKAKMGDENYARMEEIVDNYWKVRQEQVFPLLEKYGGYSPELMEFVKNNREYATKNIVEMIEKGDKGGWGVPAAIKRMEGSLKGQANPFYSTVLKDMALIRAAHHNRAMKNTVDFLSFLKEKRPEWEGFKPSETRTVNNHEDIVVQGPRSELQTIFVRENGELKGYDIDKKLAKSLEIGGDDIGRITSFVVSAAKWPRKIFIEYNPFFIARNLSRDFKTTWRNMPRATMGDVFKAYNDAFGEARDFVLHGKVSDTIDQMLQRGELYPGRTYGTEILKPEESELDAQIRRFGRTPKLYQQEVVEPWKKFLQMVNPANITKAGQITEAMAKIAGHKLVEKKYGDLSKQDQSAIVRLRTGTPDFMTGGSARLFYNNVFLFSNVNLRGIEATAKSYKENPAVFLRRMITADIVPQLLIKSLEVGLAGGALSTILGDKTAEYIRNYFERIPEHDKTNYQVIPTFAMSKSGRPIYFVLPRDFVSNLAGGFTRKVLNFAETRSPENVMALADHVFKISPFGSQNPVFSSPITAGSLLLGNNPKDSFTQRTVLNEGNFKKFKEGEWSEAPGLALEGIKYFGEKFGSNVWLRFDEAKESPKSWFERVFNVPVAGNFVRTFMRTGYSEDGISGAFEENPPKARKVQQQLDALKMKIDWPDKEVHGKELTREDREDYYRTSAGRASRRISNLIERSDWASMDEEKKKRLIKRAVDKSRKAWRDKNKRRIREEYSEEGTEE